MVELPEGFCIDATEVTRAQYAAWLASGPSTSGQGNACAWNNSYVPTCEWPPGVEGDYPVVCVDWCDAYAFCAGVGKRLCGKIGGGTNAYAEYANASESQWFAACSSGGSFDYPYGDSYSATNCNGADANNDGTVPVTKLSDCQSPTAGYAGVHDMSGNAWEWEDSCSANMGSGDHCHLRGGCFYHATGLSLRCDDSYSSDRFGNYAIGFRCCSSP